jgi:hypothetical protein
VPNVANPNVENLVISAKQIESMYVIIAFFTQSFVIYFFLLGLSDIHFVCSFTQFGVHVVRGDSDTFTHAHHGQKVRWCFFLLFRTFFEAFEHNRAQFNCSIRRIACHVQIAVGRSLMYIFLFLFFLLLILSLLFIVMLHRIKTLEDLVTKLANHIDPKFVEG